MEKTMSNPMTSLYAKLAEFGLPKAYVRAKILPSWWDDEAACEPAGFAEAAMLVSRHAGVDIRSLLAPEATARHSPSASKFKFKKDKDTAESDLVLARTLAVQVGRIAALGAPTPVSEVPSAADVRQQILDAGGSWVDLPNLLDFCWSAGIPVLHVSSFPRAARKMHGLSAKVDGRPVIILSWARKSPAWQLFVLAHELGHVSLGHLENDQVMVDENIDRSSTDELESEASRFAVELLCGRADVGFRASGRWPNADQLAKSALTQGTRTQIYPGHIVLNYAHSMGPSFYAVANAALAKLEPDADGQETIRRKMSERLDWSALPSDSSEFLVRMTGAPGPNP